MMTVGFLCCRGGGGGDSEIWILVAIAVPLAVGRTGFESKHYLGGAWHFFPVCQTM